MASSSSSNDISSDEVDKAKKPLSFYPVCRINYQARANTVLSNINRVRSGLQVGKGKGKKRSCAEREEVIRRSLGLMTLFAWPMMTKHPFQQLLGKKELTSAGLGEQKIVCQDVDCDAVTFKKALALQKCGNARTYIRQLQKDLELTQKQHIEVKEKCLICGIDLPLDDLLHHIEICRKYNKGLIKVKFSDEEFSLCRNEEATYMHFVDFIAECEKGSIDVSLDDV
uniref:Uncharacterized protein n=1 Tax=Amphimedon queenslandica TaxID=400682 RepID=A0A1X7VHW1_AMPQE